MPARAWQTHKPICAATPWSLAQHRFHGKGQRDYVRRLVQDHLIHTLAWKREPSPPSSLLTSRILPTVLFAAAAGLVAALVAAVKRYALSLTLVWARTLAYERESANARGVWRDHVLPFLLDASTVVPEGGAGHFVFLLVPYRALAPTRAHFELRGHSTPLRQRSRCKRIA